MKNYFDIVGNCVFLVILASLFMASIVVPFVVALVVVKFVFRALGL